MIPTPGGESPQSAHCVKGRGRKRLAFKPGECEDGMFKSKREWLVAVLQVSPGLQTSPPPKPVVKTWQLEFLLESWGISQEILRHDWFCQAPSKGQRPEEALREGVRSSLSLRMARVLRICTAFRRSLTGIRAQTPTELIQLRVWFCPAMSLRHGEKWRQFGLGHDFCREHPRRG